jgi:hypothetical protein
VLHGLLSGAIDYAGLFPPAGLSLPEAFANYQDYQSSPDAWALGRFVIPVSRLEELRQVPFTAHRSPLTVVMDRDLAESLLALERFDAKGPRGLQVESVELRVTSVAAVESTLSALPARWARYLEVPFGAEHEALLDAVAAGGGFAKLRTGGTSAEAFPSPEQLVLRLVSLARRRLAFKATAGLHHALRGSYRLTYEAAAPDGVMFGYLNLLLAAAVLWQGDDPASAEAALLEQDPASIRLRDAALQWRDTQFAAATLAALRRGFFHGFGSCSFREPLDELVARGWS